MNLVSAVGVVSVVGVVGIVSVVSMGSVARPVYPLLPRQLESRLLVDDPHTHLGECSLGWLGEMSDMAEQMSHV